MVLAVSAHQLGLYGVHLGSAYEFRHEQVARSVEDLLRASYLHYVAVLHYDYAVS